MQGRVRFRSRWDCEFTVRAPADLVAACGRHRSCFIPRSKPGADGRRWFEVHFERRPDSAVSGILALQETLRRAATDRVEEVS